MSDDHDDLLNFEIADGDFAEGTLNEDELLLSDEDRDDFDDDETSTPVLETNDTLVIQETPPEDLVTPVEPTVESTEEPSDTGQTPQIVEPSPVDGPKKEIAPPLMDQPVMHPQAMGSNGPRQPYRQKFQRWPNQSPRWNSHPMAPQQLPQFRQNGPPSSGPGMRQGFPGPGPQRQMRPNFPPHPRPPFFNNNFMPNRPPMRQRFYYPNGPIGGINEPSIQGGPAYVPNQVNVASVPAIPRKVLINPNFKGGVEAAKNQLLKDQLFSSSSTLPEDELLRKQQEFINHNMRQIEKRRHERTPSPDYRRGYSHSPSPPRYRRRPFRNHERRRDSNGNEGKGKDENLPEEDEETRAYRQQIETQRRKREEILRQKEMRRKQQAEKAKETAPAEPLQPIVVTDKKIVLKKKSPEKSMTPPLTKETPAVTPATPTRRIVLKPSKDGKAEVKQVAVDDGSKRKIRKILNS